MREQVTAAMPLVHLMAPHGQNEGVFDRKCHEKGTYRGTLEATSTGEEESVQMWKVRCD